jgi:large subunit ribosomal protein L29
MNLEKIRQMTDIELENELVKMKTELFNLRFQHVTGQLENPVKMREVKRDIARIKTVMREKELAAERLGA